MNPANLNFGAAKARVFVARKAFLRRRALVLSLPAIAAAALQRPFVERLRAEQTFKVVDGWVVPALGD